VRARDAQGGRGIKAIVIGGGTSGLAAAIRLARSGRSTTLLEASDGLGGIASSIAFHPGFRSAGLLDGAAVDAVGAALGLRADPRPDPVVLAPARDPVTASGPGVEKLDRLVTAHRALLTALLAERPPRIDPAAPLGPLLRLGVGVRRGGVGRMRELLRIPLLAAEDWLTELEIPADIRGLLEAPALLGSVVGPRQPTTAALVLLSRLRGTARISGPRAVEALTAAAAGVDVRLGARVARIRVEAGAVRGVSLADGTAIDAPLVLAAIDPRSALLGLLDPFDAGPGLRRAATPIRARGAVAQLLVATSTPPAVADAWIDIDPRRIEAHFDRRKYEGTCDVSDPGPLHLTVPSAWDPALAPAGSAVVSIRWIAAPSGHWDGDARESAADAMLRAVEAVLPGFGATVLGRRLLAPPDIAAAWGCAHPFHAEHAVDQLWAGRPAFGLGHYATPIRGLFLGSAGSHPGGGMAGTGGWLAAGAAL
jgi:phytoene dehydrogenase-like protein